MQIKKYKVATLLFLFFTGLTLMSCQHQYPKNITGIAFEKSPLVNSQVRLLDAKGKTLHGLTDAQDRYFFSLHNITAPLLISVSTGPASDCVVNSRLRPICMSVLVDQFSKESIQIANINPLTDRLVSDVSVMKGFIGPQQWINSNSVGDIQQDWIDQSRLFLKRGFGDAFVSAKLTDGKNFNPATYSADQHDIAASVFSLIHHNRNYDNNSGETGHTTLADISFRPIVGLFPSGEYEPLNFFRAHDEFNKIKKAKLRIFIVGDSTSAVYEQLRFPRMGWGQAFAEKFLNRDDVVIVVGSRAGRSSRDFYNGRWFAQMEPLIQPGDYLLINHGHNDQNCDALKPIRGAADVMNLCTYPNDDLGQPQFPLEKPEMSFQHSLENYLQLARKKSAIPILFTPTTRIKNAVGLQNVPVVTSHYTRKSDEKHYRYVGDYSKTIREVAIKNQVPLIDLETASIQFVNSLQDSDWKDYWLVVDENHYPFYANGMQGSRQLPDGTHFQKKGAEVMAELVSQLILQNSELAKLSEKLFNQ
ncbi:MAG: pectin acetylesterase [Cellvibrio sp.]|nr:pectin acetylesterase [Cellvibrio sp.]